MSSLDSVLLATVRYLQAQVHASASSSTSYTTTEATEATSDLTAATLLESVRFLYSCLSAPPSTAALDTLSKLLEPEHHLFTDDPPQQTDQRASTSHLAATTATAAVPHTVGDRDGDDSPWQLVERWTPCAIGLVRPHQSPADLRLPATLDLFLGARFLVPIAEAPTPIDFAPVAQQQYTTFPPTDADRVTVPSSSSFARTTARPPSAAIPIQKKPLKRKRPTLLVPLQHLVS